MLTRTVKLCIDTDTLTASQREKFAQFSGAHRAVYNWCVSSWRSYKDDENAFVTAEIIKILGTDDKEAISTWRKEHPKEPKVIYKSFEPKEPTGYDLSKAMAAGFKDPNHPLYWNRPQKLGNKTTRAVPANITTRTFNDFSSSVSKYYEHLKKKGFSLRKNGTPVGSPQFKARHQDNSFGFSNIASWLKSPKNHVVTGAHRIKLPYVGSLRVHNKTNILARYISDGGVVKTARFTQAGSRWYVALTVSLEDTAKTVQVRKNESKKAIGIDAGINKLMALSDGTMIENPRHIRASAHRIIALQRKLSTLDSSRQKVTLPDGRIITEYTDPAYAAARLKLKNLMHKMALQRSSYLHQITKALTVSHAQIALEDLNIAGMLKSPAPKENPEKPGTYLPNGAKSKAGLAQSISDAAWGELVGQFTYKAQRYGSTVTLVNPAYTSRTCSSCGNVNQKKLEVYEVFVCEQCQHTLDRDTNAALNILNRALIESV